MTLIELAIEALRLANIHGNDCPAFIADHGVYEGDVVFKTVKEWLPLVIPYGEPEEGEDGY